MSSVILKEMPSALTELLFSSSQENTLEDNFAEDRVCSSSLNTFLTFVKGVFVQWTTFHSLPSDENINKLMNP